ncbi:hypothetical protein KY290_005016 [Solanum tuberosum]|uniref:Uncharacterized protein n=1 Tax=Solanum tuberosum TaxID=4113 RepID=A0ABQ7WEQ5_SOLTU|nr:hypothetical protein KY284_005125 [Solanum tuberosum]KAH0722337.1 hypothetical protein KY289_005381 [Solanum tuberosum]KAH0778589.1 hypothetical protein KY290_005016 [Solanum tuberosum]
MDHHYSDLDINDLTQHLSKGQVSQIIKIFKQTQGGGHTTNATPKINANAIAGPYEEGTSFW